MTDFRDHAEALAPRGGWLSDDASKAYLRAHGGAVSDGLVRWRDTIKARLAALAPEDALPRIGDNRQIEQAPRETAAAYRARLRRCFAIHEQRSTPDAYREALGVLGVAAANIEVWSYFEDCGIPAPPGADPWWSLVTIVVDSSGGPWTGPIWLDDGSDLWSDTDGGIWGLDGLTIEELQWARRTIRRWKWAGAFPLAIYVILSGSIWGDGSVWSDSVPDTWSDLGGDVVVLQLSHVWGAEQWFYGAPPAVWLDDGSDTWEEAFTF